MTAENPVAYSYVRLSSDAQMKGDGLRRQKELSAAYAAANGLQMATAHQYQDLGVSAFKGDNLKGGALGKFIAAAEGGEIVPGSYLLVESLDRISRQNLEDALGLFLRIVKAGVRLVTLTDGHVYEKGKLDQARLFASIIV